MISVYFLGNYQDKLPLQSFETVACFRSVTGSSFKRNIISANYLSTPIHV